MANFKSFGQETSKKSVIKFFLNVAKKAGTKPTVLGKTHNGVIFASPDNDSSWIQFRAISDNQGATPIELEHQGKVFNIDPFKFWTNLFSCSVDELPDVKIKANIGDIEAGEAIIEQGGCLVIEADVAALQLSTGEYKGQPIVYFHLKVEDMYLTAIKGKTVDTDWVLNSLSGATVSSVCGKETLSQFRRVKPQQPKVEIKPAQEMAQTSIESEDFDFNNLVDL